MMKINEAIWPKMIFFNSKRNKMINSNLIK